MEMGLCLTRVGEIPRCPPNSAVCCDFQVQWVQRQRSHYRDKRLPARGFNRTSIYSEFSGSSESHFIYCILSISKNKYINPGLQGDVQMLLSHRVGLNEEIRGQEKGFRGGGSKQELR